jgi:hypothetical protein
MYVELIDRLRCTASHADSWLVAAATRTVDRHIINGLLGCPECSAEYPVIDGAVWYSRPRAATPIGAPFAVDAADEVRIAALLGVNEKGGLFALQGALAAYADALEQTAPVQLMLFDPPAGMSAPVVLRGAGARVPVAPGSLRGIALEGTSDDLLNDAARALAPRGRLVAPAGAPVPEGITVLARDERQWVGEAGPLSSPPVRLRRSGY